MTSLWRLLWSIFWLSLLLAKGVECFEVIVDEDPDARSGESVELVCAASNLDDDLDSCVWQRPSDRDTITSDRSRSNRRGRYDDYRGVSTA